MEDRKLIDQIKSDLINYGRFTAELSRNKKGKITGIKRVDPLRVYIYGPEVARIRRGTKKVKINVRSK